jgi:hypothetical protein
VESTPLLDGFLDRVAQMAFAENDEVIETLVFYGSCRFKLRISANSCESLDDAFPDTTGVLCGSVAA